MNYCTLVMWISAIIAGFFMFLLGVMLIASSLNDKRNIKMDAKRKQKELNSTASSESAILEELGITQDHKEISVKLFEDDKRWLPQAQYELAAAFDVVARTAKCAFDVNQESYMLVPGEATLVLCGFFLELPKDWEAQIRPRSGLAVKHGITVLNSPGTIDADYRGEVGVILINHGHSVFPFKIGDRIAQIAYRPAPKVTQKIVTDIGNTVRGTGGMGSSGV